MGANHSRRTSDPTPLPQRRAGFLSFQQGHDELQKARKRQPVAAPVTRTVYNHSTVNSAGRDINTSYNSLSYYTYSSFRSSSYDDGLLELLNWISEFNFRNIFQDSLSRRAPGTGERFMKGKTFVSWIEGDPGVLWGTGMPGAGKTVLASIAIERIRLCYCNGPRNTSRVAGTGTLLLFTYCRYNDALSVRCILSALVRQLLEDHPEFLPIVQRLRSLHQLQQTRPTLSELFGILAEISQTFGRVVLVLDGLDELREEVRQELLQLLSALQIHLLLMSRPIPHDDTTLAIAQKFQVAADVEDVDCLLQAKLAQLPGLKALLDTEFMAAAVISAVRENARGMLLHAALQMEMLRYCRTIGDIQLALRHLPPDLESMYADTLNRVRSTPGLDAARGVRTLLWVVFAARPLRIDELQFILATSPQTHEFDGRQVLPEKSLLALCHGLITIESGTRFVRLVHYTAQVALEKLVLELEAEPHVALGLACMARLRFANLPTSVPTSYDFETIFRAHKMLEYSYTNWVYHLRQCTSMENIEMTVEEFILSATSYPVIFDGRIAFLRPVHLVAWCGLPQYLPFVINRGYDLNDPLETTNTTPLMIAASQGDYEFAKTLFSICGIRVDAGGNPKRKRRSTSFLSNLANALRLSESGMNVNSTDHLGRTALFIAASKGHASVVETLLQVPRVQVDLTDHRGRTALIIAAIYGHHYVVEVLLRAEEMNVNVVDKDGRSALIHAAAEGHADIARALLRRADLEADRIDGKGESAISLGVKGRHLEVIKMLLNEKPGLQLCAAAHAKVLILASSMGDHQFVDVLLKQGKAPR